MNKAELQIIQDSTYPVLINHHGLDDLSLVRLKETKTDLLLTKITTNRNAVFACTMSVLLYDAQSRGLGTSKSPYPLLLTSLIKRACMKLITFLPLLVSLYLNDNITDLIMRALTICKNWPAEGRKDFEQAL